MDDEEIRRYVFTAVAHQAGKELRRRRRRPVAPLDRAATLADGAAPPEERAAQREQSRITRDLLASLPRRRRAVLLLRYGWGLEPAQVCELIEGLSPRAYRKEITLGISDLTERIRKLESGSWCADRERVLKAFAAGIADTEQERQAQHHLAHCRPCADFVGKLSGHLHDLGSAAAIPGALDLAADGRVAASDRLADVADRVRDGVGGVLSKGGATASEPATALSAAAPRGAGAAGAGVIAKLAGLGAAGKAALACVGSGAVATVCVVAAAGPFDRADRPAPRAAPEREERRQPVRVTQIMASQAAAGETPEPSTPSEPVAEPPGTTVGPSPEPEPTATPPPVPAQVQQFGAAPAPTSSSGSGGGGSGDKEAAAEQEFGP